MKRITLKEARERALAQRRTLEEARERASLAESPEVDELLRHFYGLCSGTVCDGILVYLDSPDCSPRSRERIKEYFSDPHPPSQASHERP